MPLSLSDRRGVLYGLVSAIYGLLNVSAVTTLATGGLYHGLAPQDTAMPYVVIQSPTGIAWDSMTNPGEEATIQVHVVSNAPDYAAALNIMNAVIQSADSPVTMPTIANHLVIGLRWETTDMYADPELVNDVPVWHVIATFRCLVDQVS